MCVRLEIIKSIYKKSYSNSNSMTIWDVSHLNHQALINKRLVFGKLNALINQVI